MNSVRERARCVERQTKAETRSFYLFICACRVVTVVFAHVYEYAMLYNTIHHHLLDESRCGMRDKRDRNCGSLQKTCVPFLELSDRLYCR